MNSDEANVSKLQEEIESSLKKNLLFERLIYVGGTLGIFAPLTWLSIHYKFSPFVVVFLILLGVSLILLFAKKYDLKRSVTSLDAAKYMDDRFALKERTLSKVELEGRDPKDNRAALIKGQIASLAPKKIEEPIFKFKKTSILLLSILPIPWIILSWIFISQNLEIKNGAEVKLIEELIKSEKNIPDALKNSLQELGEALSKEDINSEEVKAALSRSEKALKEALEGKEGAKSDSLEVSETPNTEASPTPTTTPTLNPNISPTPPPEAKKESDKDQKSSDSKSEDDSKKDDKNQKQDGASNSTDEAKEGDSKDQKQKDGGQGKGGASDKKNEGKDSKEGQGEGKGESESKQESKSLEGVGKALEEIKEKSESQKGENKEQGDKQSEKDQKNSDNKQGDKGDKEQKEKSQKGEKGQGDKKEGEEQNEEKQKGSGKGDEQKEQDKKEDKEQSKNESKGEDKASEAQNKKESDDQKGGEDKKQVGEKGEGEKASSLPQGSELVPTPLGKGGESEGGPKTLEDVSVPGEDETLDTRFTGDTKERVKNDKGGESKVSLSDVKLSKPDDNGTGENQYVPPEYSEILK